MQEATAGVPRFEASPLICRERLSNPIKARQRCDKGLLRGRLPVLHNFGQALLPELAYFVLFLPMLLVLVLLPQGLFGRQVP